MKYIFTDIETTGLDKRTCDIVELASVAFDSKFQEIGSFHRVIRPDSLASGYTEDELVGAFEPGALAMAQKNGLFGELMGSEAQELSSSAFEYAEWLRSISLLGDDREMRLCGNNVEGFDFAFIERQMHKAAAIFHYRKLNVSAVRTTAAIAANVGEEPLKKAFGFGCHRAEDDARASFAEWQTYVSCFNGADLMTKVKNWVKQ